MQFYISFIKRQKLSFILAFLLYLSITLISITISNSNSLINFHLQPYIFGAEPIDLFFPLIVTVPFTWSIYFLKNNNFLNCISTRICVRKYITIQIIISAILCFVMVFIVNLLSIIYSINISTISDIYSGASLKEYILGELQENNPLVFGLFWCLYKSFIASLICISGQIIAIFLKNIFLIILTPFVFVLLENFITSLLRIERFSLTTTFVLNRLTPNAMKINNIFITIVIYLFLILGLFTYWWKNYEKYN